MTYRVEILCAKRKADPIMDPDALCHSHRDEEERPIGERQIPDIAAAEARKNARDAGWIHIGGVWLCPSCKPKPDPVG